MLDKLPPVAVLRLDDQTLLLVDGYHRVAAAQKAGRTTIDANIREGTRADAVKFAADVAVRERGFSDERAREAIKRHSGRRWPTQGSLTHPGEDGGVQPRHQRGQRVIAVYLVGRR